MDPLDELRRQITRLANHNSPLSWTEGMTVFSTDQKSEPLGTVTKPVLVLVAQGAKRSVLGDRIFDYHAGQYLVVTVDVPLTSQITHATAAEPFLAFELPLKPAIIAQLLLEAGPTVVQPHDGPAVATSDATGDLLNAVVRLLRLLDDPQDFQVLAPGVQREIHWRLMNGPQAALVRQVGLADSSQRGDHERPGGAEVTNRNGCGGQRHLPQDESWPAESGLIRSPPIATEVPVVTERRELRRCLGQFATGVTVVGCWAGNVRHGATVNAFTAVSLDPPLVLVALDRRSKASAYLEGRPFSVTVLAAHAHEVALHFSGRAQKCPDLEWVDAGAAPRVAGGVAALVCSPWASYDGGDHILYLGEVQEFSYQADTDPLIFHSGLFRSVGGQPGGTPWSGTLDSPEAGVGWRMRPFSASRT